MRLKIMVPQFSNLNYSLIFGLIMQFTELLFVNRDPERAGITSIQFRSLGLACTLTRRELTNSSSFRCGLASAISILTGNLNGANAP
jgi:hypothetical protein